MRTKVSVLAVVLAVTLAVSLSVPASLAEDGRVRRICTLRSAINAGYVDAVVELFEPDAVVIQPRIGGLPQIYVGQAQIRWWLQRLMAQHVRFDPSSPLELD